MKVDNPKVALSTLAAGAAFLRSDNNVYMKLSGSPGGGNTFTGTAPATQPCCRVDDAGGGWFGGLDPTELVLPLPGHVVFS